MRNTEEKNSVSLEALLRLKRNERPSADFWDSFDHDFERRRLHALVESRGSRFTGWNFLLKSLSIVAPVLLVAGVVFLRLETQPDHDSFRVAAAPETVAEMENAQTAEAVTAISAASEIGDLIPHGSAVASQFIVDTIETESNRRPLNFRKVLYTPAIHLSAPNGAFYVRDNLSSVDFRLSTADMKAGQNF